jgi:ankyrin repeat protein
MKERSYDVAQILLDHGAKPNVANKDGKTPLHLAFEFEPEGCNYYAVEDAEVFTARLVLLLLEHGADVNVQDKDQRISVAFGNRTKDVRYCPDFTYSWRGS